MSTPVNDALKAIFSRVGWFVDEKDYPAKLARARETLANPEAHPGQKETAALIVAAADGPLPEGPAAQPIPAATGAAHTLAQIVGKRNGVPVTLREARAQGWAGVTDLTEIGQVAQEMEASASGVSGDLLGKAAELKIDIAQIRAACDSWNRDHAFPKMDFPKALAAEIGNQKLLAKDRERTSRMIGGAA